MSYISTIQLPNGQSFDIKAKNILPDTTTGWESKSTMISQEGFVYIYTDHQVLDGENIPGVKIGTANAYVIDLPFVDAVYAQHIVDNVIHLTQAERESWNNKVTCYIDPSKSDKLVFSKE